MTRPPGTVTRYDTVTRINHWITAISLVLVFVVNRQSFNWSIDFHAPYALLATLVAILMALAVVTAIVSAREAMGMGPVRAVREDW